LSGGTITTSGTCAVSLTAASNYLAGPTALNTSTFTDGPSVAAGGVGTWAVFGTVMLNETAAANPVQSKLWDGTTVIDNGFSNLPSAGNTIKARGSGS
jgi:hypothetical protein